MLGEWHRKEAEQVDALPSRRDPDSLRSAMAKRALDPGWLPGRSIRLYGHDVVPGGRFGS
jgi:hypothetical protein